MSRKNNIIKNLYFSLFSFIVLFIFIVIFQYIEGEDYKGVFLAWTLIFVSALTAQVYLNRKKEVANKWLHYVFIMMSINISMFGSFLLKLFLNWEFVDGIMWRWVNSLISSLIISLMLLGVKEILWLFIARKHKKSFAKELEVESLSEENQKLQNKILSLEESNKELENELISIKNKNNSNT